MTPVLPPAAQRPTVAVLHWRRAPILTDPFALSEHAILLL